MQLDVYNAYADCSHQVMRDEHTYIQILNNYATQSQPNAKAPITLVQWPMHVHADPVYMYA